MAHTPKSEDDNEFDFTRAADTPPPAPEKVASARKEASTGTPALQRTGFYVAMARHAGGRVPPRTGDRYELLVCWLRFRSDQKIVSGDKGDILGFNF